MIIIIIIIIIIIKISFLKIHTFSLLMRVNSIINNNKLLIMILILLKSYKKMHTKLQ